MNKEYIFGKVNSDNPHFFCQFTLKGEENSPRGGKKNQKNRIRKPI